MKRLILIMTILCDKIILTKYGNLVRRIDERI